MDFFVSLANAVNHLANSFALVLNTFLAICLALGFIALDSFDLLGIYIGKDKLFV